MLNTTERFGGEAAQSQPRCVTQPPPESASYLLQGRRKPHSGFLAILIRPFPKEPCWPLQKKCLEKEQSRLDAPSRAPFFLKGCWMFPVTRLGQDAAWNKTQLLSPAWRSWCLKSFNWSPSIREKYPYRTKFNKETFLLFQLWQWRVSSAVQHCLWQ